jgi:hypothetical protein
MRLFLMLWLASFGVQSTGVFAMVAPDACVEGAGAAGGDDCPDACVRCVCCSRLPVSVSQLSAAAAADHAQPFPVPAFDSLASGVPHDVLHVPKPLI